VSLQFTVIEVLNALLGLDSNKSPGQDGVDPEKLRFGVCIATLSALQ
jgi:hypothetical protein